MVNYLVLLIALMGCFYLGLIAHEIVHAFQKEQTDICFSIGGAHVENNDVLYYETPSQHRRAEVLPVIVGTVVWLITTVYVVHKLTRWI